MWDVVEFFLALAPIIWLIIALSGLKMPAFKAAPIALLIAAVLALVVWKLPAQDTFTAALEGAAMALWPIILVIIAAVFTYNLSLHTGAMEKIKQMLTGVSTDKRILVLIIAWGFGGFLEGMAGFGTAVAIPASMLWALGFNPMFSALVCLIANATPTAFGSIGIPTVTLGQVTGLDTMMLSNATALQLLPMIILTPFVLVMLTGKSIKALKGVGMLTLLSGVAFAVPEWLVAKYLGPELAVVLGSISSMLFTILGAKFLTSKKKNAEYEMEAKTETVKQSMSLKDAVIAWLPFILILVFLVMIKLVPWFVTHLGAIKTAVVIYSGGTAPYTFTWVATPGVMIVLATFIGGAIQGASFKTMASVLWKTIIQMWKTIVTIISVVAVAKIMGYSGMISTIAVMIVGITGSSYPLVAPLIGSLGSFITGSGTSATVLFGKLQTEAAAEIAANPYWLAVANTCGATVGKMISPQNIAIGAAAVGLAGSEGEILNSVLKYYILFIVLMGLITFFGASIYTSTH